MVYRLNRILPRDISVWDVFPVADDMHARFSATSRTYHYYIHTRKDPFERHFSLQINYPLDFYKMNEAAKYFLQHEDYVGRGKISMNQFLEILHQGTRSDAGESMPGNALFLEDVSYPEL